MPRLQNIPLPDMSPEQRRVHDAILSGPRGVVEGPLKVWLHSPQLADRAQALGAFCRYGTSLPARLSELAILMTGAFWRAGFEWHVHEKEARKAGLSEAVIEAIHAGEEPPFSESDEAAVFAVTQELLRTRAISDQTYRRAVGQIGERGIVDLVGVLGYYTLISMTIVAFQVPVPEGAPDPFQS